MILGAFALFTAVMDDISARLERWTVDAAQLVGDVAVSVPLRMPCPVCGARFTYRQKAGETVPADAAAGVRGRLRLPVV